MKIDPGFHSLVMAAQRVSRLCVGSSVLAVLGLAWPLMIRAEGGTPKRAEEDRCVKGSFTSEKYLFSVKLPENALCCTGPAPSPVHGCAISGKAGTHLWVDGSFNTLGFEGTEDALNFTVGGHLKPGTTLKVLRHEPAKLGTYEAVRLTFLIKSKGGTGGEIEDIVVALIPREGRGEIIYTVGWKGPEVEYSSQTSVLAGLVASWRAENPN